MRKVFLILSRYYFILGNSSLILWLKLKMLIESAFLPQNAVDSTLEFYNFFQFQFRKYSLVKLNK